MNVSRGTESIWSEFREIKYSTPKSMANTGVREKLIAMLIFCLGSFLFGMLPATISRTNRQRFPLTMSLMLCFGGGVLLATSLIHILPDVRDAMASNWAEITFCGGFLLIYFVDEVLHYFLIGTPQPQLVDARSSITSSSYGTINNESNALLPNAPNQNIDSINASTHQSENHTKFHSISTIGLIVALSVHSTIEGIAIGVQNTPSEVLFLMGAVACHKFVMAFCLGLQMISNLSGNVKGHLIGISVFGFGAAVGIGLGMLLVDIPSLVLSVTALSIIQGIAGGTLLYVTVCEIIPREKVSAHKNSRRKIAGIAQFLALMLGFSLMVLINFYFDA
ncbi:zinc transporter ZIP1-like [Stomoxys calcitrans]|uniref:zinc transporter ZIP1-like n=1 Tax=Stomoxys calcitrans TaxID=35570 RepID=UPI0027E217AA|nr:zinc transporter ZIP1-like [Stomoxys calcitrans]